MKAQIMKAAHTIAKSIRNTVATYAQALSQALKQAWAAAKAPVVDHLAPFRCELDGTRFSFKNDVVHVTEKIGRNWEYIGTVNPAKREVYMKKNGFGRFMQVVLRSVYEDDSLRMKDLDARNCKFSY